MDIRPCAAAARNVVQQVAYTKANYPSAAKLATDTLNNVVSRWGSLINKYRGALPMGVVAVRIQVENSGNPNAVSANQEKGLLQLWPADLSTYGVTNPFDPDQNLKAGCKKWLAAGSRFVSTVQNKHGIVMDINNAWPMVQLDTMVGSGAMQRLVALAVERGLAVSLGGLVALVSRPDAHTFMTSSKGYWGSQPPSCVAHRVVVAGIMDEAARIVDPAYGIGGLVPMLGLVAVGWILAKYVFLL